MAFSVGLASPESVSWGQAVLTARPQQQTQQLTPELVGERVFVGAEAWQSWLLELEITNERHVLIATEGALLG